MNKPKPPNKEQTMTIIEIWELGAQAFPDEDEQNRFFDGGFGEYGFKRPETAVQQGDKKSVDEIVAFLKSKISPN